MTYGGLFDFFLGLVKPLFPVFDILFGWFFYVWELYPASILSMLFLSAAVAAIISSFYVILIDKEEYNGLREKQKDLQQKMKDAREDDDMDKANKYMKESMSMQKEFMKKSLKPMFASMLVFFIFIPWVLHTFVPVLELPHQGDAYEGPMEVYGVDMKPAHGSIGNMEVEPAEADNASASGYMIVYQGEQYRQYDKIRSEGMAWQVQSIDVEEEESATVKLSTSFIELPFYLPLVGYSFEWLGTYIIFQIPFTFFFRKLFGVQ